MNEAGVAFHDRLVDELLAAGITPAATLYPGDLPQALEGGANVRGYCLGRCKTTSRGPLGTRSASASSTSTTTASAGR